MRRTARTARCGSSRSPSSASSSAAPARSTCASTSSRRGCCATGSASSGGYVGSDIPLILVSNRGPATFERDDDGDLHATRGGGGLVTALKGLVEHRDALWIASAMNDEDAEMSERHGGKSFECEVDDLKDRIRLVQSDPEAYDQFYNVIANPLLWFIQHYLWDLSDAPDIRSNEVQAYEQGYTVVNEDLANAVLDEVAGTGENCVVMLRGYHVYTAPKVLRRARPDL